MNIRTPLSLATALSVAASVILFAAHPARAQGTAFTYNGRLNDTGGPANGLYDISFGVFAVNAGGIPLTALITNSATPVSNGLFTARLDFGGGIFTGPDRWLELAVRTNGIGGFTILLPRQELAPSPYAIMANTASNVLGSVPAGQLSGTLSPAQLPPVVLTNNASGVILGGAFAGSFAGDGSALTNFNASQLTSGTVPDARLASNIARTNQVWSVNGNAGTSSANFLGTTDNQALELRANGSRALRLAPNANAPIVIGGYSGNTASSAGATVGGGGQSGAINNVANQWGTIAGGRANTASGSDSTVAGGSGNTASGQNAAVAGGGGNSASGDYSFIAGGTSGTAAGTASVALGGFNNIANANYSLAGGSAARANHPGTFVWADNSSFSGFSSTGTNQFLIRAIGGVGIGKNNPSSALDVAGTVAASLFNGGGAGLTNLNAAQLTSGVVPAAALGNAWQIGGNTGTSPAGNFVGTADNQPIEFRVNNARALRLEPNANGAPNFIAGAPVNSVQPGTSGATIAGGGATNYFGTAYTNSVTADFATVSGGRQNNAASFASSIGGGQGNVNVGGLSAIGGGWNNLIQSNPQAATIAGGEFNLIQSSGQALTIGGGGYNTNFAAGGTIGGGANNLIQSNATWATIPGGSLNNVAAGSGSIGGGYGNTVPASGSYAAISGGQNNNANGANSFVGGGQGNYAGGAYSAIAGGQNNTVTPSATASAINGGYNNYAGGTYSAMAGGYGNYAGNFMDAVGGGNANTASGGNSAVAGGTQNRASGNSSIVGGGGYNLAGGTYGTVGGGYQNNAAGYAAAVSGGLQNTNLGQFGTIPGGDQNLATNSAFASGHRAKAQTTGSFVWADSTDADFSSTANNQFLIRASGGVGIGKANPATALDVAGTVTATSFSGSGAGLTNVWQMNGNSGTAAGVNFLGTSDNQPLELKVNSVRALRLEPSTGTPNLIGGYSGNFASSGIVGGTIAGGGASGATNKVSAIFAAVGGGIGNSAGGSYATVGGGSQNSAVGAYSVVPGGNNNFASGQYSFAAGQFADALHDGAFVWADSTIGNFPSTGNDQFLIRAAGGVGIGKNNPSSALDVSGTVTATGFSGNGSGLTNLNGAQINTGTVNSNQIASNAITVDKLAPRAVGTNVAAGGVAMSASSGLASGSTGADVTNLIVTITSTGRPVFVGLIPDGSTTNDSMIECDRPNQETDATLAITRDSNVISRHQMELVAAGTPSSQLDLPPGAFFTIDVPAAGAHTYRFRVLVATASMTVRYVKLVAYEL
jgi:hypothetical protein